MMLISNVAFLILIYLAVFLALAVIFAIGMTVGYKLRDRKLRSLLSCREDKKNPNDVV